MTMAERESRKKWSKEHTTVVTFRLQNKGDADIIEYLNKQESKAGKIKELIRAEIEREEE